MRFAVGILTTLTLFMAAGALPAKGGGQAVVFRSPVFILLLTLLALSLLWCCWRRPRIGFLLCHAGIVLILAGALLGHLGGVKTQFAAPIAMEHGIDRLPGPNETAIPLPFALTVTAFDVQFYDPGYHVYLPPAAEGGEYRFERTIAFPRGGTVALPKGEVVRRSALLGEDGAWVRQHLLPSGRLLQMASPAPRHYEAALKFTFEGKPERTASLAVNHPVAEGGWRFYLMSYDQQARRYVVLSARRDPGRGLVIAGLWVVILGTAWVCWAPRRRSAAATAAGDDARAETPCP